MPNPQWMSRHDGRWLMAVNLVFFSRNGRRKDISLGDGVTIVGRRPDCDIRIPLLYVSRKHCRFICKEDKMVLQDLGSANGTFVNSERIMEAEVNPGDQIGVGSVTFTIQIDGEPSDIDKPAFPSAGRKKEDYPVAETSPSQSEISETLASDQAPPFDSSGSHEDVLSDFDIDEILGEEDKN